MVVRRLLQLTCPPFSPLLSSRCSKAFFSSVCACPLHPPSNSAPVFMCVGVAHLLAQVLVCMHACAKGCVHAVGARCSVATCMSCMHACLCCNVHVVHVSTTPHP
jgi:hypothetical protein